MAYQFLLPLNNLNDISIDLLPDITSDIYRYIFFRVKTDDRAVTRRQPGFIGCRASQLIYTIICLIWKPDFNMNNMDKLNKIVSFIIKVYNNCILIKSIPELQRYIGIYDFIFGNQPLQIEPIILNQDNINEIQGPSRGNKKIIIAALVQDPSNPPNMYYPQGNILHYFNIITDYTRTNKISIISSYGSDCVSIPQQELILDLAELVNFIKALEDRRRGNIKATEYVSNFMINSFLPNGLTTRIVEKNEETSRRRFEIIDPSAGKIREIIDNITPYHYRVFIYPTYFDIVSQIIYYTLSNPDHHGGKRRKGTNKRRQTKKRNKRRRTNKRYNKRKN